MGALPVVGHELIHLDRGTSTWVAIIRFAAPEADDLATIAALIASPGYADDYISPPNSRRTPSTKPRYTGDGG